MMKVARSQAGALAATRRRFLMAGSGLLSALIAGLLGIPLVSSVVSPVLRKIRGRFVNAGQVPQIPSGSPVSITFSETTEDAYLRETVQVHAWAVSLAPGQVTVYSPICPHLGCRYDWRSSEGHFFCPCHDSTFALDGKVLGGPAPRPLDTLPSRVEKGDLYVEWERFEPGIPYKRVV